VVACTGLIWLRIGARAGCCQQGNELVDSNQLDALNFSNIFICLSLSTCFGHYVPIIRRDMHTTKIQINGPKLTGVKN
jgi:hypothetical protein